VGALEIALETGDYLDVLVVIVLRFALDMIQLARKPIDLSRGEEWGVRGDRRSTSGKKMVASNAHHG
jgi:hypothetical protein